MSQNLSTSAAGPRRFGKMESPYLLPALLVLAGAMEIVYLVVLRLGNLKEKVEALLVLLFLQFILYFVSIHLAGKIPPRPALLVFIFVTAAVFRLTLFPLYPSLSDDLYRYRWEGKVQQAGYNPYQVRPTDPELAFLKDQTFPAVAGPQYSTIYGPLLEALFRLTVVFTDGIRAFKLPFLLLDLGVVLLLFRLLPILGISPLRSIVYAWSPLAVVEFGASGHNDSLAVFALVLALLFFHRKRERLSVAALAASALAKLFAAFLLPVFLLRTRWKFVWVPALLAALAVAPYARAAGAWVEGLSAYAQHWRNNESLFLLIRKLTPNDPLAWRIYGLIILLMVIYCLARGLSPERASFLILGTMLLCSPNVFPWYLIWILPLLAIYPSPAWLLLTATAFLSYHVLIPYRSIGIWREQPFFQLLEYAPFYALLIGECLARLWKLRPVPGP